MRGSRASTPSAALALPGVAAVLTGEDIARAAKPVRAESKTPSVKTTSFPPLALGKVRHVGEAVVMVAAESRYVAEDAVEHIVVEFEPLPVVKNTDEALDPASPVLHEDGGNEPAREPRVRPRRRRRRAGRRGARRARAVSLPPAHAGLHGEPRLPRGLHDGEPDAHPAVFRAVPRSRARHLDRSARACPSTRSA